MKIGIARHKWEIHGMFEGSTVDKCEKCGLIRRKRTQIYSSINMIRGKSLYQFLVNEKWDISIPECFDKNNKNKIK